MTIEEVAFSAPSPLLGVSPSYRAGRPAIAYDHHHSPLPFLVFHRVKEGGRAADLGSDHRRGGRFIAMRVLGFGFSEFKRCPVEALRRP